MFVYNTSKNEYINLNNQLSIGYQNILIRYLDKILLPTNPNLYICEDLKEKNNWRMICSGLVFESTTSKPCFNGKFAYFSTTYSKIYRLDCESGTLSLIKQP